MTNDEISKDWRGHAESPYKLKTSLSQAGALAGECTGEYVEVEPLGRRAWMKPIVQKADDVDYARAAREKIAADLAYDLGLPVPPVLLARYGPTPLPVSVSLVMYPMQFAWEHVRSQALEETVHGLALAQVISRASPMLAFDTWIKQVDHDDHPHNIIWGYDPKQLSDSRLIFIDFAFSTGFDRSWNNGMWTNVKLARFPPLMLTHLDKKLLEDTVQAIERVDDAAICSIVDRVPEFYLPGAQKATIKDGLMGRKNLIRKVMPL